jgi:hypothetical protein
MRTDPRLQKWCNWLKIICDNVQILFLNRDIFSSTIDIIRKNELIDKSSMYFGFYVNMYIDSMVMGIRRQLKTDDESISLAKLLKEIANSPETITRSDFQEHYKDFHSHLRELYIQQDFDQFANPEASYINAECVNNDLQVLKETCTGVEQYADRRIAHWDKRKPVLDFSEDVVNKALDTVGELMKRYYLLLFAANLELHPVPQYPIFHIFEVPWIKPSDSEIEKSA